MSEEEPKYEQTAPIEVEYIESGTFQGGEEDVFLAGIKYGEDVYVLSKPYYERLRSELSRKSPADEVERAREAVWSSLMRWKLSNDWSTRGELRANLEHLAALSSAPTAGQEKI